MAHPFPSELSPTAGRVADWVEFRTLQQTRAFKRGDLRSAIQIEDVDGPELLEVRTWELLELRARLFGDTWPLILNGSRLTRRRSAADAAALDYYRYLLLLGMGEIEKEDRQLFELLVGASISALTQHPSLRLGAPALPGTDSSFRKRVEDYARQARLIEQHEFVAEPLPSDQDFGLDVVSWVPFEDRRSGYLHVIAQCATGDDWDTKLDELHIPSWSRHINWAVPPLRVFGVPFAITRLPVRWVRLCARAGLMLDRPRLMELNRRKPMDAALSSSVKVRVRALAR